jgi:hypothetical protein
MTELSQADAAGIPRRQSVITAKMLEDPDYYVDIKDLTIGPLLGSGAFSFVYSNIFQICLLNFLI